MRAMSELQLDKPMGEDDGITRRVLLRAAAGASAGAGMAAAAAALPAWARPVASAARIRRPDSLPFPKAKAGTPSMHQIQHIVVVMMENHSFDNLLGMVPYEVPGRSAVDGLTRKHGRLTNFNADAQGHKVFASAAASPCQLSGLPKQDWNASHLSWNNGRNDGFVKQCGPIAMRFWDQHDLPFTYSLVKHFPIGQRYFCSTLCQTYPNRRFFFTGTASGLTATDNYTFQVTPANGNIFERLHDQGIEWANYYEDAPSLAIVPGAPQAGPSSALRKMDQFYVDAAAGKLPPFTFLDPNYTTTSEENPQDIQLGERYLAKIVRALTHSPLWKHTALFITWDEHGGYYDHVPPPAAIRPDKIDPLTTDPDQTGTTLLPGTYNRYGFRVPVIVVSPWARAGYVSKVVQDHTSITAFIERKWNLPAMTFRDANAHPMTDYFDFSTRKPAFLKPPRLHAMPGLSAGLAACHAQGLNPPLTEPGTESD
jgi:phospholipase C